MESQEEEVSRNFESRKEEVMGSFSFQNGTLCGLQPSLLSSGHPLQQENFTTGPTGHIPPLVIEAKFNKLDTHLRFGVSMWHYVSEGPDQTNLKLWFKPWETGPRSVAEEEFSWATGYLPWTSMDEKYWEETREKARREETRTQLQTQLREVVNLIPEIREAGNRVPSIKEVLKLANQRLASWPPKQPHRPGFRSRRQLVFDS